MKTDNIINILKGKSIIIPNYLLLKYKELNINEKELIFLSYLVSLKDLSFDIESFEKDLNFSKEEIITSLSSLEEKNIISVIVKKENNIMKEYIDLTNLYNKVLNNILEEESDEEDVNLIYSKIEEEFGRTLSPIEYETIKRWIDSGIKEELIYEALKEAILNGVTNLKYIDKILYEWNKKGITKRSDISKKKTATQNQELFSYDWLDSDE